MSEPDQPGAPSHVEPARPLVTTPRRKRKQAIVVIHGVGEQRPMDTLRGFVQTILHDLPERPTYYSQPDPFSNSFELRRLASRETRPRRTDFFELYWAHHMPEATWGQILGWLKELLLRRRAEVPRTFLGLWSFLWLVLIVVFGVCVWQLYQWLTAGFSTESVSVPVLIVVVGWLIKWLFLRVIGDAATYLQAAPDCVAARHTIRSEGVALMKRLHDCGEYERIVVVGHSLGSVIAYDVLNQSWQAHCEAHAEPARPSHEQLKAVEALASEWQAGDPDIHDQWWVRWHAAVRALHEERTALGATWLVTDLITAGSPLAHASFLLAKSREDLIVKMKQWELTTAPPARYADKSLAHGRGYELPNGEKRTLRVLHHAAWTACTTWTNLYFPCSKLFVGDPVGGPLAPWFGPGVNDVPVRTKVWRGLLSHTHYWRWDERNVGHSQEPVSALRDALDLTRK